MGGLHRSRRTIEVNLKTGKATSQKQDFAHGLARFQAVSAAGPKGYQGVEAADCRHGSQAARGVR